MPPAIKILSAITKEGEEPSDRKPVSEAIDEVYTGRLTIVRDRQKEKKEHLEPEEKKVTAAELKSEVQDQSDSDVKTNTASEAEGQLLTEA